MQLRHEHKNPNQDRNSYYLDRAIAFVLNINEAELTAQLIIENYFSQLSYNQTKKEKTDEYLKLKEKQEQEFVEGLRKKLLEILSFENRSWRWWRQEDYNHKYRRLRKDNYDRAYNTLIHLAKAWPLNNIDLASKKPECPISREPLDKDNAVTASIGYRYDINNWKHPEFDGKNHWREPFSARDQRRINRRAAEKGFRLQVRNENWDWWINFKSLTTRSKRLVIAFSSISFLSIVIGTMIGIFPLALAGNALLYLTLTAAENAMPSYNYKVTAQTVGMCIFSSLYTLGLVMLLGVFPPPLLPLAIPLAILLGAIVLINVVLAVKKYYKNHNPLQPANENGPDENDVELEPSAALNPRLHATQENNTEIDIKPEKEPDLTTPLLSESKNESNYENKITFFAEKIKKYDPQTLNMIKTILEKQSQLFSSEPNEVIKNLFNNLIDITNNPRSFKENRFKHCLGVLISTLNTHEDKNTYENSLHILQEMQKGNLPTNNRNLKHA